MLYLSEEDVKELLPMREAIGRMRGAFTALARGLAINQSRRRLLLDTGAGLHSMAGSFENYFGTKFYSTHPKYGLHFFFVLYDARTAEPLAWMEASQSGPNPYRRSEWVRHRSVGESGSRYVGCHRLGLSGANASGGDPRGAAYQNSARVEPERGEAAEVCRGMLGASGSRPPKRPYAARTSW